MPNLLNYGLIDLTGLGASGTSDSPANSGFWNGAGAFLNGVINGAGKYFGGQQNLNYQLQSTNIQYAQIMNAVKYIAIIFGVVLTVVAIINAVFKK